MSELVKKMTLGLLSAGPWEPRDKFGRTGTLNTGAAPLDLWENGGTYTGFNATTAEPISIESDDAADVGVQVTLEGLDANFDQQFETVTLNGTTPVLTTNDFIRCPRAFVSNDQEAQGTITYGQSVTTANVFGSIDPRFQQTNICCFTVPRGKDCMIIGEYCRIARTNSGDGSALISLKARRPGGVFRTFRVITLTTGESYSPSIDGGQVFPEMTDIKVEIVSISANGSFFSGEFEYILYNNS